jgi:hypothetical protein
MVTPRRSERCGKVSERKDCVEKEEIGDVLSVDPCTTETVLQEDGLRMLSMLTLGTYSIRRLATDFLFNSGFCEAIGLALQPLLAYCASLGVIVKMIVMWRSRWNVDWQGKLKFSEKTCPSATFVHHKIPHDRTWV